MANMLQSSQTQATNAPSYYTNYLSCLASKGQAAAGQAQFADTQPLQAEAFSKVCQNFGKAQPAFTTGENLTQQAAGQNVTGAAAPYLQAGTSASPLCALSPYAKSAQATTGLQAGQCLINKGAGMSGLTSAQGYLGRAGNTCAAAVAAGNINQATGMSTLCAASPYLSKAATSGGLGNAQPYLCKGMNINALCTAQPYLQAAAKSGGLCAAQSYLQKATGTSPADLAASYMNPYINTAVQSMSDIAQRNIRNNLSPAATAAAVGSGQFGSQRGAQVLGQVNAQAEQDLNSQIQQMLASGYGQALCAAGKQNALTANAGQTAGSLAQQQATLLGQLGQTSGTLTSQQQQNVLNAANTAGTLGQQQATLLGQLGSTAGSLTGQQQQNLINAGNVQGTLTQQQANLLGNLGSTAGNLTNQQAQNVVNAGSNLGNLQQGANTIAANLGSTAANAQAQQNQANLTAAQTAAQAALNQGNLQNQAAQNMGALGTASANANLACINALATLGGQQQTIAQNKQNFPLTNLSNLAGLLQGYSIPTSTTTTLCMSPLSGIAAVGTGLGGLLQQNKCGKNLLCSITGSKTFGNLACRAFSWLGCKLGGGSNTTDTTNTSDTPMTAAHGGLIQHRADGGSIGSITNQATGGMPVASECAGMVCTAGMICSPYELARGGLAHAIRSGNVGCMSTKYRGALPTKKG
jgi:hypothetical protein